MSDKSLREAIKEVVTEVLDEKGVIFRDTPNYPKETCINVNNMWGIKEGGLLKFNFEDINIKNSQGHKASIAIRSMTDTIKEQQEVEIAKASTKAMEEHQTKLDYKGIKVNSVHGTTTLNENGLSFDFGVALEHIKDGLKVCRRGWNGRGMYVKLEKGGDYEFSEINPFFVIKNTSNSFNTCVPSISDLLAEDWILYFGE